MSGIPSMQKHVTTLKGWNWNFVWGRSGIAERLEQSITWICKENKVGTKNIIL